MRSTVFWKWFAIGALAAGFLLWGQSQAVGGPTGLLQVGEQSNLRPIIEAQLGEVALSPGSGHDGQIFYAIGLDLRGEHIPELLDHGGYRYRRILFPLLASGFGFLDGWPLLIGMIVTTVVSAGVAVGALAALAERSGMGQFATLALLFNPGFWSSIRLLTADTLAMAFMVGGLALLPRIARSSTALSLATLAKDAMLVTAVGLAISRDRKRWLLGGVPLLALVLLMTWISWTMGDGFAGRGNLTLPFLGLVDASSNWPEQARQDTIQLIFALTTVLAGLLVGVFRRSWLRWSILGWVALALVSSSWVWDFGNNAARAFAPLLVLVVLSFAPNPPTGSRR